MGQKVHPNGICPGIVKPWNSTRFANTKEPADNPTAILKYVSS